MGGDTKHRVSTTLPKKIFFKSAMVETRCFASPVDRCAIFNSTDVIPQRRNASVEINVVHGGRREASRLYDVVKKIF